MQEQEIISALLERDECAIQDMQQCFGTYCAAIASKILDNKEDIEEVINDTWLHAWNSIPPTIPQSLKLFLAKITRNLSYDHFRKQTRKKRCSGEIIYALDELKECVGGDDPVKILEAEELKASINRFLSALPQRERSIFLMRYFMVESVPFIAEQFMIRETNVRAILSRTRKKLRVHLSKEGFLNG